MEEAFDKYFVTVKVPTQLKNDLLFMTKQFESDFITGETKVEGKYDGTTLDKFPISMTPLTGRMFISFVEYWLRTHHQFETQFDDNKMIFKQNGRVREMFYLTPEQAEEMVAAQCKEKSSN